MKQKNTGSLAPWTRETLDDLRDAELLHLEKQFEARMSRIERTLARDQLFQSIFRKRSGRVLIDSLSAFRMSRRIEKLFESTRKGVQDGWPVEEVLAVFDGLIARMLAKRMVLFGVALFTIIPSVGSLILLARQNQFMIEENTVEQAYHLESIRKSLLEVINGTSRQLVTADSGNQVFIPLPTYHKRIREEAFGTYISIDKQRWSTEQIQANPPVRYVDLRGCNLEGLALGGALGLVEGESRDDLSRVFLAHANLRNTKFLRSRLTGSVFRNSEADGILISSPDATDCDFSGIHAPGARFYSDAKTSTPLDLSRSNFDRANLSGTEFDQVFFIGVSLNETVLSGAVFKAGLIAECDLTQADLGDGITIIETPVHKTLVRREQLPSVRLPPFCVVEETEDPDVARIMTDEDAYDRWWEQQKTELDAAAEKELEEVQSRNELLEAAGEI